MLVMPISALLIDYSAVDEATVTAALLALKGVEIYFQEPGRVVAVTDTPDHDAEGALLESIRSIEPAVHATVVISGTEELLDLDLLRGEGS